MRIAFMLPGMHRIHRGAEVAFESIAARVAAREDDHVTVFGSGPHRIDQPYDYVQVPSVSRERFERFPTFMPLRTDYIYEEATWTTMALRRYRSSGFDLTVTCSYPFVNWMATRWPPLRRDRPAHVFVTQNGDHPARSAVKEYRAFRCDGLVCTNPVYLANNRDRWRCALIPNGIDVDRFTPGAGDRRRFGLPEGVPIVLMVSALVPSKRVLEGVAAVSALPDAHLVIAGDGPLRQQVDEAASRLMPGRLHMVSVSADSMADLYRSCDVFLHTTLLESFGNVYVEAASCGLPVVVQDSEVTRWIFGDHPGLTNTTDLAAMTAALASALHRSRPSTRLVDVAERFSWDVVADQYRQFFDEVVAHAGR